MTSALRIPGQDEAGVVLPCHRDYDPDTEPLWGALRLAILASTRRGPSVTFL